MAEPGAGHCDLGKERQRQDPGDQYQNGICGRRYRGRFHPDGVIVNVTAIMTIDQVRQRRRPPRRRDAGHRLGFCGPHRRHRRRPRAADGRSAKAPGEAPERRTALGQPTRTSKHFPGRSAIGCHIITVTKDVLAKLPWSARASMAYSLETVEMFLRDAVAAGF